MSLDLVIYAALRLSALLTVLAVAAVVLLTGGWEAAAAGLAVATGIVFCLSFMALLVDGERTSAPTRA